VGEDHGWSGGTIKGRKKGLSTVDRCRGIMPKTRGKSWSTLGERGGVG